MGAFPGKSASLEFIDRDTPTRREILVGLRKTVRVEGTVFPWLGWGAGQRATSARLGYALVI